MTQRNWIYCEAIFQSSVRNIRIFQPEKPKSTINLTSEGHFTALDALVAYCMVRHFQPRLIIEVGSGFSSLVLGQAAAKNKSSA